MLRDRIKKYYLKENCNCAEALLHAADEEYMLDLKQEDMSLMSGFGTGMGMGSTCGALVGMIAVLGKIRVKTKAHETEGFKEECALLAQNFQKALGSMECRDIMPNHKTKESRCLETILLAADVLQDFLQNDENSQPNKVTVTPEEIKRVKALGFLHNKGTDEFSCRVITRNGLITSRESKHIAQAAEKFGNGTIAMTTRLTMELPGVPYGKIEEIREFLSREGLETGGTGSKVRPVVACKGTTCQYGLYDTFSLSEKIHERFFKGYANVTLPHKFKIALGGCPNNCVKPDLNDFGIIGQKVPSFSKEMCKGCKACAVEKTCPVNAASVKDGVLGIAEDICNHCGRCVGKCPFKAMENSVYGYRIAIGGRWGKKTKKGRMLSKIFTSEEEVMKVLEQAILLFREQGHTGERFADTIERIGFDQVEKQLLSEDLLGRKAEILGAVLHQTGGATC